MHVKGVQNLCFCQLSMQILWRRRCSRVVDPKLSNLKMRCVWVSGNITDCYMLTKLHLCRHACSILLNVKSHIKINCLNLFMLKLTWSVSLRLSVNHVFNVRVSVCVTLFASLTRSIRRLPFLSVFRAKSKLRVLKLTKRGTLRGAYWRRHASVDRFR